MPLFEDIPHKLCRLEPGDCVYLPTKIIHHVRSWGRSLAANIFWDRFKDWDKNDIIPSEEANLFHFMLRKRQRELELGNDNANVGDRYGSK